MIPIVQRLILVLLAGVLVALWATSDIGTAAPPEQRGFRPRALGDGSLLAIQRDVGSADGLFRLDMEGGGRVRIAPLPPVYPNTAFDPTTRRAFLLRSTAPPPGSANLLVIDTSSGSALTDVPLVGRPVTIDYDSGTSSLILTMQDPGPAISVYRVNPTTGVRTPIVVGLPTVFTGSTFDPVGRRLILLTLAGGTTTQLIIANVDAGTFSLGPIIPFIPGVLLYEPSTGSLLITRGEPSGSTLYRIHLSTGVLTTITTFASAVFEGGAYDPATGRTFLVQLVQPGNVRRLRVIDTTSGSTIYNPDIGFTSAGLQYDPTTDLVVPTATPTLTPTSTLTPTVTSTPGPAETQTPTPLPGQTLTSTPTPGPGQTPTGTPATPGASTLTPTAMTATATSTATATVGLSAAPPAPDVQTSGDDDTAGRVRLTGERRYQQQRTNRGNRDDVYTEGNVLAVDCASSQPTVTLANRDGDVTVALSGSAVAACASLRVGDYLEAEGEKVHELQFEATQISVSR